MKAFFPLFLLFLFFLHQSAQTQDFFLRGEESQTLKTEFADKNGKSLTVFVHFPPHKSAFANRVIEILEDDIAKIHHYFDYQPQEDIHIVVDSYNAANGSALVFPRNTIRLNDFPPYGYQSLVSGSDWLQVLVIHEYVHIITLEMTHGYMDRLRKVFGSSVKFAGLKPRWFLEGIAVWAESYFTGQGRVHHPWIRREALNFIEDQEFCADFHCFDNPHYFPFGHSAYWVGGLYLDFIERHSPGAMKCLAHQNSKNLPLSLGKALRKCLPRSAQDVFNEFVAELREEVNLEDCPLTDKSICQKIRKKNLKIDWFRGFVQTNDWAIIVENKGRKGIVREMKSESVLLINSRRNKWKRFRVNYPIDQIYQLKQQEPQFVIMAADPQFNQFRRQFIQVDPLDMSSQMLDVKSLCPASHLKTVFVFPEQEQAYCLWYESALWKVAKNEDEQKLSGFDPLYNPVLNESGQLQINSAAPYELAEFTELQSEEKSAKDSLTQSQNYNSWPYLRPTYLLANYFSGGNIHSLGLMTNLTDPLNKQSFYLEGYYNLGVSEVSPYTGTIGYTYNYYRFTMDLSYQRMLAESNLAADAYNISETIQAGVSWQTFFQYGVLIQRLGGSESQQVDPLFGSRQLQTWSYSTRLMHYNPKVKDRYRSSSYRLNVLNSSSDVGQSDFWGVLAKFNQHYRLHDDFHLRPSVAYGKYFKSGRFREGILYGGGADSFFHGNYFFNSYAVPFSDVFGNEIASAQLKSEWVFTRPFWGNGLLPMTVHNISWLNGLEYFRSDFFVVDRQLYRDDDFTAYFTGLKLDGFLLYLAPVSLEIVLSKVLTISDSPIVGNVLLTTDLQF